MVHRFKFVKRILFRHLATSLKIRRSNPSRRQRFSLLQNVQSGFSGPSSLLFYLYRGSFPVVNGPERKVDHLPPLGAKVKNGWNFTYALPLCFHIVEILYNPAIQVYQTPQNDHSTGIRGSEERIDLFEKFSGLGFVRLQRFCSRELIVTHQGVLHECVRVTYRAPSSYMSLSTASRLSRE